VDRAWPVLLSLLLVSAGPPVYVSVPVPTVGGVCYGTQVQISSVSPAHIYACINALWADVTPSSGGGSPGGSIGNLQTNNGSGGFGAYAGSSCTSGQKPQGLDASGNVSGCSAPTASAGGSNTQVQFNDSGTLNGSSTLTWDKTNATLTFGTANTIDAIKFTTTGARLHVGTNGTNYFFQDSAGFLATPGSFRALNLQSTVANGSALSIYAGQNISSYDSVSKTTSSTITGSGASNQNLDLTANASQTPAGVINLNSNTNLGSNTITSSAATGFVGNASTASALASTPTLCTSGQAPLGVLANGNATGCFTPTYTLPPATASTLGGVIAPSCSAGYHYSSVNGSGTLQCTVDAAGGGGAPTTSKYLLQQADASLPNAQAMGSLSTGIVKNTTSTGVQSIASSGTDYAPGTSGNGTGLVLSTTGTGALSAYAGTSCTNQFPRSLNASGAASCSSVALGSDVTGSLPVGSVTFSGTQYGVPYYSTTSALGTSAAPASATVLLHGNASGAPTWSGVAIADHTATGTPSSSTFLRGDNTWSAPAITYSGTQYGVAYYPTTTTLGTTAAGTSTTVLHGNASGSPTWSGVSLTADTTANQGTATTLLHGNASGQPAFSGVALADFVANLGTTTTVLHGNASGQPSYGAVALGSDVSGSLPVASVTFAGTTYGVPYYTSAGTALGTSGAAANGYQTLHGNSSGAPTWSQIALNTDVTGTLPVANVGFSGTQYGVPYYTAASTIGTTSAPSGATVVLHGNGSGAPTWSAVNLASGGDVGSSILPMANGGTGANISGTVGALLSPTSTTVVGQIADVAVGSALVSGGVGAAPSYSASGTCTSSSSTTCTITGRRSGCLPVCSMTTSVSTTFRAAISSTTITCTFGTSGTNTCNCICF